jgi:hemolysin activation/secretion protein
LQFWLVHARFLDLLPARSHRQPVSRIMSLFARAGAALAVLFCVIGAAQGQTQLPGPAQSPQIQDRFRPGPAEPSFRTPPPVTAPRQPIPPGSEALRFRLEDVRFTGLTVYSPETLRPYYASLVGNDVSLADMITLANTITARLREDGYILSQVVVPEQVVQGGVIELQVVEGFVDEVVVEGDIQGPQRLLDEFTAKIRAARPLTAKVLERNLLLIGDLPGVNVQGILEPSPSTFGAARLRVVIKHLRAEGFVTLDNRGSRFVGPWGMTVGGSLYSQLGRYEQLDALVAFTPGSDEWQYIQSQVTIPVGPPASGDTLQFFVAGGRTRPDIPLDIFPLETRAHDFEGRVTYFTPMIRSRTENLSGLASFIWRDERVHTLGIEQDEFNPTRDHVRVLQLRGTYDITDRLFGVSLFDLAINQGLGILGASDSSDPVSRRTGADGTFTYLNGTIARLQGLGGGLQLYGEVNGQYSFQPLLPTERFGVGGARFGRGYPPGNITGDHGIAGKLELRYGGRVDSPVLDSYQLYTFVDAGRVWDRGEGASRPADLATVGAGARLNLSDKISVNPEIAHQLTDPPADKPSARHETRFLVSVEVRF